MTSPAPEASLSVASLIDEVVDSLHGYVRGQEQHTSLGAAMGAADITFTVANPNMLSRGLVEIDSELIQVSTVDASTGTVSVEPWGRAQSGSTAASHSLGARVTQSPLYPRQRTANAIYGVLREVFPDVFAVGETLIDVNPAKTNYVMPDDCYHVTAVEWHLPGPTGMWAPAKRWRQNKPAAAVELELLSPTWPGPNRGRVRYMRVPPTQVAGTDDLAAYGYDRELRDLIVLGAVARMLTYTEASRVQAQSVESHGRSEAVPAGAAQTLARYAYQVFKQRLDEERRQILLRHPLQPHQIR